MSDSTGAVLPDVKVTLTSHESNLAREATTDASGTYTFNGLGPGGFGDNSRAAGGSGSNPLRGNAGPGGSNGTSSIFRTENQVQVSANGTRNTSNSFQIDGVEVNSLAWGGAAVITPNEESVKEVNVVANGYSAEYGRNSGAQVLVVSQNGTNTIHGSLFFKADRPGLNAYQRWNGPASEQPGTPQQRGLQRNTDPS